MKRNLKLIWLLCLGVPLGGLAAGEAGTANAATPASFKIEGLGWWGDREMKTSLSRLIGNERGLVLDANAVEDAIFLLMSAVQDDGFLKPVIAVEMTEGDGRQTMLTVDSDMMVSVPRATAARALRLRVTPGVRYFITTVNLSGLQAVPGKTALGFFVGESTLFTGKAIRAYTPARLTRGMESLEAELRQRGYAEAKVVASEVKLDDSTGEVRLGIEVTEGLPWRVEDIRVEGGTGDDVTAEQVRRFIGRPWSEAVQQDIATEIRNAYYAKGFPDVSVRMTAEPGEPVEGRRKVVVAGHVEPGQRVTVGRVRFEGAGATKEKVLRRRVHAKAGEALNLLEFEQARYRISRLGVFDRVDLHYEPKEGPVRDPVFALQPGRSIEVNLLAGYGTYEQLRGGVEVRQFNLFGLAHQTRGLLIESMKSTRGEYAYTVPEIFGELIDGTARVFGLQREEVAFERQEYGGSFALTAPVAWLGANATAAYTFQALRNRNNRLETQTSDDKQVTVASLDLGLTRDRRDNPLVPRRGYRWFAQIEAASRFLGGQAEYQRSEVGGSYHTGWGDGRWVHLSVAHGVITTWGSTDQSLPVNKRFYPGGDGSNRGYRSGAASPRGGDGRFIGAKSYLAGTVEFEQALARKWSLVLFADALGTATQLRHYPFDAMLYAAGGGVRYLTLIGPIRGEYGHNLNPRPGDPGGTWLLSVGFPF